MQTRIEDIDLGLRTRCVLEKLDVRTIDQLLHLSEGQLARIRLVGDEVRRELCSILTLYLNVTALSDAEQSAEASSSPNGLALAQHRSLAAGLRKVFWESVGRAVANEPRQASEDGALADAPMVGGTPLRLLGLPVRPYNGLMRAGVTTIEQLLSLSSDEVLAIHQLGSRSMSDIEWRIANPPATLMRDRPKLALAFAISRLRMGSDAKLRLHEATLMLMQEPIPDSGLLTVDDRAWLSRAVLDTLQDPGPTADDELRDLVCLVSRLIEVVLSDRLLPETIYWLRRHYPHSFLVSESPVLSLLSLWPRPILDLSCSAVELPLDRVLTSRLALPPNLAASLEGAEVQSLASLLANWDRVSVSSPLLQGLFVTFVSWLVDQPRGVWEEEAQGIGICPAYKHVLQGVCVEKLVREWAARLRGKRNRQIVLLRYGVDGSQLTLQECAWRYDISRERVRQIVLEAERRLPRLSSCAEISVAAGLGEALIREAGGIISEAALAQRMESFIPFGRVPIACALRFLFIHQSEYIVHERSLKAWRLTEFPTEVAKQLVEVLSTVKRGRELLMSELQELIRKTDFYLEYRSILTPEFIELCIRFYGVPTSRRRGASSPPQRLEPTPSVNQKSKSTLPVVTEKPRATSAVARKERPTPSVAPRRLDNDTPLDRQLMSALRAIGRAAHYEEVAERARCSGDQARVRMNARDDTFRNYGLGFYGLEEWGSGW